MSKSRLVHIVDDDDSVRESAAILLESAGYDVVEHVSGVAFLEAVGTAQPGCVILDMHMPVTTGLQVQAELINRGIPWPVIVLTGQGDIGIAVRAMKQGAFEFMEKPYQNEQLLRTLEEAFAKFDHLDQETARVASAQALIDSLSQRELQIVRGLLAGLPNKLIAYELDLSTRTVEIYRANAMDKLKAPSLSTALRIAMTAGVQPLEERRKGEERG
jgi:two-component system response regulator FixJ